MLALAGCNDRNSVRFTTQQVSIQPGNGSLRIHLQQNLKLSQRANSAVRNGVPVILELSLELRDSNALTLIAADSYRYEIRYLPMSERYQLRDTGRESVRSYPRLRHVLRELADLQLAMETPTLAAGTYEIRTRLRLDRASLPAPVQLPSMIFRAWRHDTNWSQWPFTISA